MIKAVYKRIAEKVQGYKTLLTAALFALAGLVDYFEVIDLKPFFSMFFGEDVAAKIMIFIPVVFAVLRYVTNGPIPFKAKKDQE